MKLNTCSQVISAAKGLESESAEFYEALSQRYSKDKDVFLCFVQENRRNIAEIERAYYGVISDAIEGCFAFDLDSDDYALQAEPRTKTSYHDDLVRGMEIEDRIIRFYLDATEKSGSLMADVPRAFKIVAKRRNARKTKLQALMDSKA